MSEWQAGPDVVQPGGSRVAFRVYSTAASVLSQLACFAGLCLLFVCMSYFPGVYHGVRYSAHPIDFRWASLAAVLLAVFWSLRLLLDDWVLIDFEDRLVLFRRRFIGRTWLRMLASFDQIREVQLTAKKAASPNSCSYEISLLHENGRRLQVLSPARNELDVVAADASKLARRMGVRFKSGQLPTPGDGQAGPRPATANRQFYHDSSPESWTHRLGCLLAQLMVLSGVGLVGWIVYQLVVGL